MNELQKLYDWWSESQGSTPEVREAGCRIMEYLFGHCTDEEREEIAAMVIEYGRRAERGGFQAGFRTAFRLFCDVLKN